MILGLAGVSLHHGALAIMRSAGRLDIPVSLLCAGRPGPIGRSRYNRHSTALASGSTGDRTLAALRALAAGNDRPLLVAVDDASAMFLDDHGDSLSGLFRLPSQPPGLARALADKRSMQELCVKHAVATPLAAFPACEADVLEHAADARFPVVAKRIDASRPATSAATPNVLLAQDASGLLAAYRALESPAAPNVMLQEHIPDAPEADWMFNGYFDRDGRCAASFTGLKLRQSPPDAGATTLGLCQASPALAQIAQSFLAAVGYRGIVDLDFRFDRRDGRFKLLDVNPRIGSSFRLFVGDDGLDVLRALYFDLAGQSDLAGPRSPAGPRDLTGPRGSAGRPAPTATARDGRRWLVEPQDLRSSAILLRRRQLGVGKWLRSLRHVRELAWWAPDDPRPFLAMIRFLLAARFRKLTRR